MRDQLGQRCIALAELPDSGADSLAGTVISVLRRGGDAFLRTGVPRTETLLLLALQVHRHEAMSPLADGRVVLEDRGVLSVAVYQAAILESSDAAALTIARRILATAAPWRPPPSRTVLLRDDPGTCLQRLATRVGRPARPDELVLMERAEHLYDQLAEDLPHLTIIDRRTTGEAQAVRQIAQVCENTLLTGTNAGSRT